MHASPFPFRLGSTSYIIPDDIIPNVRFLAGRVEDVELVLFEVDDGPSNLPTPADLEILATLARSNGLSYTVHLPLDLDPDFENATPSPSLQKACKVIRGTLPLQPFAYIAHLNGHGLDPKSDPQRLSAWHLRHLRALEFLLNELPQPHVLCIENLESYPPQALWPILERLPVSTCVDIGHLWLQGLDPVAYLQEAHQRTRVVHLHGIAQRDHNSLIHTPPAHLDAVIAALLHLDFTGVLTLEVFNQDDLETSQHTLLTCLHRVTGGAHGR